MEITWLGHSCFRLRGSHGVVITDPYPPQLGYPPSKLNARVVTVSHNHNNHSFTQGIGGEPRIISRPGEYEISEIYILGVPTYHDNEQGKVRGKNIVYLYEIDDITICHLGDLGHLLNASHLEKLENADVLLAPVGAVTTIDAAQAAELVRHIEPKIVIPMHYKTSPAKVDLEPLDRFLKEMGGILVSPQPKINVNRSGLPETMQVVVLDYPKVAGQ
jgi:L-ascorbate metabolism protein UlaG (beta-lactamase superfamily)